jgi:hypothetical protein
MNKLDTTALIRTKWRHKYNHRNIFTIFIRKEEFNLAEEIEFFKKHEFEFISMDTKE